MKLTDSSVLERVASSLQRWNSGDLQRVVEHYRDDAVLCFPSMRQGRRWIQGPAKIQRYFGRFRQLRPSLKVIDLQLGSQFYTAVLSDEIGFVTFQIEPDAQAKVRRVIVCRTIWNCLGLEHSA